MKFFLFTYSLQSREVGLAFTCATHSHLYFCSSKNRTGNISRLRGLLKLLSDSSSISRYYTHLLLPQTLLRRLQCATSRSPPIGAHTLSFYHRNAHLIINHKPGAFTRLAHATSLQRNTSTTHNLSACARDRPKQSLCQNTYTDKHKPRRSRLVVC